jgi:Tol biopolymer transport system component
MTPAISSTGRLAYVTFSHTLDLIWLDTGDSPSDGTPLTRSNTRDNFAARVAPDGHQVVFYSNRSGSYDIWLLDRESGEERALTDDVATDFLPDWSPNGQEVVFMSNREGTGFHLWKVAAAGGPPQRLTIQPARVLGDPTDVHYGGPRWAPDGESIGYINVAGAGLTLTVVDPNEGEVRPTNLSGLRSFDWYLDSHRVIFTRQASDGDGTVELIAANLDTFDEVVLLRGPITEIDVAPDGRAVSFVDAPSHFDMNLFELPLGGPDGPGGLPSAAGPPRRLTDGNGIWHVHAGGWAPDGGAVVFTRDEDRADVFVIDNYR